MTNRWLSYPLLALALLLAVFTAAHIVLAEQPEDCAPEDREIAGNTNSPCKWDYRADTITSVRYDVVENAEGNTCHEVLVFSPYNGAWDVALEAYARVSMGRKDARGTIQPARLPNSSIGAELVGKPGNSIMVIPGYRPSNNTRLTVFYSVNSSVPERSFWVTYTYPNSGWYYDQDAYQGDYHALKIDVSQSDGHGRVDGINNESNWLPMPANINDFNLLMNDCLAGIKQRLENEAKLEETRQKVEAERVAQERGAIQAAAEAERQRLETEAAREALRIARETELAKTQALIEQLEREKIIIAIWQEIVDEKLAGAKARADITNTYLIEIEANAAEFKTSVVAKAAEVRRLQEINDAIADSIIAHNNDIERQLAAQEEREAEQRKKLEDLHVEPSVTAVPGPDIAPTDTP